MRNTKTNKHFQSIVKVSQLIIIVAVLAFGISASWQSSVPQAALAAPAPAETDRDTALLQRCYDKYNGADVSKSAVAKAYNGSKCPKSKDKGGLCTTSYPVISCPNPSFDAGEGSEDPSGSGGIPNATDPALNDTSCQSADKCDLVDKYVNPFIKFLSACVGLAVVIGVIWGAIQYSSSAGDPQKVAAAKDKIRKALVAFVVFIFLFALLQWLLPGGVI